MPWLLETSWTELAIANYAIDPAVLAPYVPAGTTLEVVDGRAYVSVVGFMWTRPKLRGFAAPLHDRFAELNLRTYAHRGEHKGVVFLKELVGMPLVAWIARDVYHENFALMRVEMARDSSSIRYDWYHAGRWSRLALELGDAPPEADVPPAAFFLDRHHAFSRLPDGGTMAYPVARATGRVRHAHRAWLDCDAAGLYGKAFAEYLAAPPASAFWAAGSPIRVGEGVYWKS